MPDEPFPRFLVLLTFVLCPILYIILSYEMDEERSRSVVSLFALFSSAAVAVAIYGFKLRDPPVCERCKQLTEEKID